MDEGEIVYGKKVKRIRIKNGLTQMELGAKIGKSKQWISAFERGNIRLNLDVAVQLATVLGVAPAIFLPGRSKNIGQMESENKGELTAPEYLAKEDRADGNPHS